MYVQTGISGEARGSGRSIGNHFPKTGSSSGIKQIYFIRLQVSESQSKSTIYVSQSFDQHKGCLHLPYQFSLKLSL